MTRHRVLLAATVLGAVMFTACSAPQAGDAAAGTGVGTRTAAARAFPPQQIPVVPVQPAGSPGTPQAGLVDPATVDDTDPVAVAIAVITTMNRWDTRTDLSRLDATRRAGRWLTPTLLAGSLHVPAGGDAAWNALAAHSGYSTVDDIAQANEYGQPPDTPTSATVQLSYVVHEIGRDRWVGTTVGPGLDRIRLSRTSLNDPWLVSGFATP